MPEPSSKRERSILTIELQPEDLATLSAKAELLRISRSELVRLTLVKVGLIEGAALRPYKKKPADFGKPKPENDPDHDNPAYGYMGMQH